MKKIEAIIRKSKLENVRDALHEIEVNFFTYWEVSGIGNDKKSPLYQDVDYNTHDIARYNISIVVTDDFVEETINIILEHAYTGKVGDGKIFVIPIEEAYRIRTIENGKSSL